MKRTFQHVSNVPATWYFGPGFLSENKFSSSQPNKQTYPQISVQFSGSVVSLCDPMTPSMPDLPVHHKLPEFIQTHVHPVSDAIQPSHPLSSPSPPAPNPSQHQDLFQ